MLNYILIKFSIRISEIYHYNLHKRFSVNSLQVYTMVYTNVYYIILIVVLYRWFRLKLHMSQVPDDLWKNKYCSKNLYNAFVLLRSNITCQCRITTGKMSRITTSNGILLNITQILKFQVIVDKSVVKYKTSNKQAVVIYNSIVTWCFSYWPSYRSEACCIGLRHSRSPI